MSGRNGMLARVGADWRKWLAAALALGMVASILQGLAAFGGVFPEGAAWRAIAESVFLPWSQYDRDGFRPWVWLLREHDAARWTGQVGLLLANGQWEPRLDAIVALAPGAIGAFLVLLLLWRTQAAAVVLVGAVLGLACWVVPSDASAWLTPQVVALAWALGWGAVQVTGARRLSAPWWSWFAGAMAALSSPAGALSSLTLLGWALWARREASAARRPGFAVVAGYAFIAAAGLGRWALDGPVAFALPTLSVATVAGALAWSIGVGMVLRAASRPGPEVGANGASVVGVWIHLLVAFHACSSGVPLLACGLALLVQVGGWAGAVRVAPGRATVGLAGVWLAAVVCLGVDVARTRPPANEIVAQAHERTRAVRSAVASGDRLRAAEALGLAPDRDGPALDLLMDRRFAPWLPASVRAPLAVAFPATVVASGEGPVLPLAPDGHPWWGVRRDRAEPGLAAVEHSERLRTGFPWLQVHVAGTGGPGQGAFWLETESGGRIDPLQTTWVATSAWRRVTLPGPDEAFSLVLSAAGGSPWFAVSAPVEMGWGTWLAGKVAGVWAAVGALALACLGLAATGLRRGWAANRSSAGWTGLYPAVPWALLAAGAVLAWEFVDPHAAGADAAGYIGQTRLWLDGRMTAPARTLDGVEAPAGLYVPLGYVERPAGDLAPAYPSGLSLLFAAAAAVLPLDRAVAFVIWMHLVLGVVVVRALAQAFGLSSPTACLVAAAVGLSPVYLLLGLQPMTDVASLVWVGAALLAALRSRENARWAVACGVATAMAVLLRPTNVVAFPALALAFGSWRARGLWVAGAIPGALWQLGWSWRLYGSPFATGYGDMSTAFLAERVAPTLAHYAVELTVNLTPLIWLCLALPGLHGMEARRRWLLGLWAVAYLGFYVSYYYTVEAWWYLRFVLPAFPALAIAAAAVAEAWLPRRRWVAAFVVTVVLGNAVWQAGRLEVLATEADHRVFPQTTAWFRAEAPPDAVVFAFETSAALFVETGLTVLRFDQVEPDVNERVARQALAAGRPVYAALLDLPENATWHARLPAGQWVEVQRFRHVALFRLESLAGQGGRPLQN